MSHVDKITLPNGSDFILRLAYSTREVNGVTVLVIVSCISLIAVVGLLAVISLSAFNTRSSLDEHLFVRTHVAAYFICVLFCDLVQAIGSIINVRWIQQMGVEVGHACTTQGVMKQVSDVGAAFWTLVIAIHTFCLLVLELKLRNFVLWTTLVGGWSGIAAIVIAGPAALDTAKRGPFHSISGYWCWISSGYPVERITLDYMIMFLAAFLSFVLYTLIFLKLRGNLYMEGRRIRFKRTATVRVENWRVVPTDNQAATIARQMLLYPVAYTILILPIACARFSDWSGHEVPFEVTIFSGAVFLLSGTVNVILFSSTRRILPPQSMTVGILKFSISRPRVIRPATFDSMGPDPYYAGSSKSERTGFDEKDESWRPGHVHTTSESSGSNSLPYQHTVAPLNIRKDPIQKPPQAAFLPEINVAARSFSPESLYSVYASDHTQQSEYNLHSDESSSDQEQPYYTHQDSRLNASSTDMYHTRF